MRPYSFEDFHEEAIVYSYFDENKSEKLLQQCLLVNPNHPRAHYIRGIILKAKNDLPGAMQAYEMAITHYSASDHFHLNETYNNLGTVFYAMGNSAKAQVAWEKALLYLPSDEMVKKNLSEFICHRPMN